MASTRGNMKGFYRQKKKDAGIVKPSTAAAKKKTKTKAASDLAPHLNDEVEERDDVLRQFDLNMVYGPCLGMTRLARWERADRLGLNPPPDIEALLKNGNAQPECVWSTRV